MWYQQSSYRKKSVHSTILTFYLHHLKKMFKISHVPICEMLFVCHKNSTLDSNKLNLVGALIFRSNCKQN